MKIDARVDLQAWERSIQRVHSVLKRKTLSQIINRSAGSIALKALTKTKKADYAKVRDYFNKVTGVKIAKRKRGKLAGTYKTTITRDVMPIAYAIYNDRFKGNGLRGEPLRKVVKAFVARSLASIAYLRHGWKEVLDIYRPWMKQRPSGHKHKSGKNKLGDGSPAKGGGVWTTEAIISNRAVLKHEGARPMMEAALIEAMREETSQLVAQAEKMIAKDLKEAGA